MRRRDALPGPRSGQGVPRAYRPPPIIVGHGARLTPSLPPAPAHVEAARVTALEG